MDDPNQDVESSIQQNKKQRRNYKDRERYAKYIELGKERERRNQKDREKYGECSNMQERREKRNSKDREKYGECSNMQERREKRNSKDRERYALQSIEQRKAKRTKRARKDDELPLARRNFDGVEVVGHSLGPMTIACPHCGAFHFLGEKVDQTSFANLEFTICCARGKVTLPLMPHPPEPLCNLLTSNEREAKHFREKIRSYNAALAFTSVGVHVDHEINRGRGPYIYKVRGELMHRIGSILPLPNESPKFAQVYIYDGNTQLSERLSNSYNEDLSDDTLLRLQIMLNNINPYARIFKTATERMQEVQELSIRLIHSRDKDLRRYNSPSVHEVAGIIEGDINNLSFERDIILEYRTGQLKRVSALHPSYSPLHYVLLFPTGKDGWHPNIPLNGYEWDGVKIVKTNENARSGKGGSTRVTQLQFYAYLLQHRQDQPWLLLGGSLFQQYIVDAYACTEQNRLNFVRENQKKLRSEVYSGLQDALNVGDHAPTELGKKFILPSTFQGSPRSMMQMYQDSMAIVAKFGKPDIFLTFTCNPKWEEIENALLPGQQANDRPDLVSRVFQLKLTALFDDITKKHIFGKVNGYMWVIEFQKRGLPHAHILLILDQTFKLRTPEEVDSLVSAEIPDPHLYPKAYETVTKSMVHGPCGKHDLQAPCNTEQNECKRKYPRAFNDETCVDVNGYPVYRRRNERTFINQAGKMIDNRWIVPYNLYLASKYGAHINVEVCSSIVAVKYLHKYIYKGPDRVTAIIEANNPNENDEVKRFLDGRYISASEASWRLFSFKMHDGSPTVTRLAVHLPNEHQVIYDDDMNIEEILEKNERSSLTEYFKANKNHPNAKNFTYPDFPIGFVWNKNNKTWTPRKRDFSIGRMYFVSPMAGERYYLRSLLTKVKGAISFQSLRTIDGCVYGTFKEACIALGLFHSDEEWDACLREAANIQPGAQMRHLFVCILIFMEPKDSKILWETHKDSLMDDCNHILQQQGITNPTNEDIESFGLHLLNNLLMDFGKNLQDFQLPLPKVTLNSFESNRLIETQLSYCQGELHSIVEQDVLSLNHGQSLAYDAIINAYLHEEGKVFFIDGPGGTGKTYLENLILKTIRSNGHIALAIASSGIASLLLDGGHTAHSTLKIPINLCITSICNISKRSHLHKLLQRTRLILWDEAPMMNKLAFEAIDRSLRDLLGRDILFGGIVVVTSGDFRQILPVVPKGSRADIVQASLKNSFLWNHMEVFHLTQNMRALESNDLYDDLGGIDFATWLLRLGNNELPKFYDEWVICPKMMILENNTTNGIIDQIYSRVPFSDTPKEYFAQRAILAPKNDGVKKLNDEILNLNPGDSQSYLSADSVEDNQLSEELPMEFLNSLELSGMPSHCLCLKVGVPIILLRNLHPSQGLCNGTRLITRHLGKHVISAEILTGKATGNLAFIPRITCTSDSKTLPFILHRKQFPLKLSYAMTINKAQGQTFEHLGLDLRNEVFSHGQLYVAFSRNKSPLTIKVLLPDNPKGQEGLMRNVVYNEALF